ncbi:hypothetical protein TWF718_003122 [Orbilia javanica]|uniref:Uncharacterized protein n=1 Tax=Orbilia javanica TaxID=47235 RepID=A0AAN8MJD9_9PEZI
MQSLTSTDTATSSDPVGPSRRVRYYFSCTIEPGTIVKSATIMGTFRSGIFQTFNILDFTQDDDLRLEIVIQFNLPRLGGPCDGKFYYCFKVNDERYINPNGKKEERFFSSLGGSYIWNILEQEDLIPYIIAPNPQPQAVGLPDKPQPPPAPVPRIIPKTEDAATQQLVSAVITPQPPPKLKLQARHGLYKFSLRGNPAIKKVSVTGLYDAWGRKRTEQLIWNPKTGLWEATLRVSIPDGEYQVKYAYVVSRILGLYDLPLEDDHPPAEQQLEDIVVYRDPLTPVDISKPEFICTASVRGPNYIQDTFVTVIRARFPGRGGKDSRFALGGATASMDNYVAGEMKWNPVNSMWEIRIAFDWERESPNPKLYYQIKTLPRASGSEGDQGDGDLTPKFGDWEDILNLDLPHEMEKPQYIYSRKAKAVVLKPPSTPRTKNYILISKAQKMEWPFEESILTSGKHTFSWKEPSGIKIKGVSVKGPFTRDPNLKVSHRMKRLQNNTWSLTFEIPIKPMVYRYLIERDQDQQSTDEIEEFDRNVAKGIRGELASAEDFQLDGDDEGEVDITISRSTLLGLLDGSLGLDRLPPALREIVESAVPKAPNHDQEAGFDLSKEVKATLSL